MLTVIQFAVNQHIWNTTEFYSVTALIFTLGILGVLPKESVYRWQGLYTYQITLFSEWQEGTLSVFKVKKDGFDRERAHSALNLACMFLLEAH